MQTTIDQAIAERDAALKAVEKSAGPAFLDRACFHVLMYLKEHGPTAGEDLTDACHRAGIVPHSDKAFGNVYLRLSRRGLIQKCGTVARKRGHMTAGGNVWGLKEGI